MIDLSAHEAGSRYTGDHGADLLALQKRIARAHNAMGAERRRAIVVLEGWSGIGVDDVLRRLAAALDPCRMRAWAIGEPGAEERDRHFLWRFWRRLPGAGEFVLFDGSWYGRVLGDRVAGVTDAAACRRACDEINEFEAGQAADGTILIKLFVHLRGDVHANRLHERMDEPELRWTVSEADIATLRHRERYREALDEMLRWTDHRWAPWRAIDGNSRKAARIAALQIIADRLESGLPSLSPQPDGVPEAEPRGI